VPDPFILTAAEMRGAEQRLFDAGLSIDALMARAGGAVADMAWRYAGSMPALVLCGPGNNGGDGYVAARLLRDRGMDVRVAALADPATDAAATARRGWDGPVETLPAAAEAPLVIDALFGTGLSRPLDAAVARDLSRLVGGARFSLAVDLPSGIATDSGALLGPVPRFSATAALGALKPAHRLHPAAPLCGHVVTADIGIAATSALTAIGRPKLAAPAADAHKYSRGMVAVVAGAMPGAAHLAAMAAQRGGAGYVLLLSDAAAQGVPHAIVQRSYKNGALDDPRLDVLLVGPGLGRDTQARRRLDAALGFPGRLVLDGDALALLGPTGLKRLSARTGPTILTPHAGEFDRLFGSGQGSKVDRARAAADRAGSLVVFKGPDSVVAEPGGRAAIAGAAPSWLASAGTGDVLAGIVAALVHHAPFDAACAAVWLHADAARRAGPALIADDLVAQLPASLAACL
jgi:hydroxyethylthiazole kinase-like uncharacterized protein yjeF